MGLTPALTRFQRTILRRLTYESPNYLGGWVPAEDIDDRGALEQLFEKGFVERKIAYGPKGGAHKLYRPKDRS